MNLTSTITGSTRTFDSIRELLAKANEEKTGDELAGIAADSEAERVAAKDALSRLSLEELRQSPVVPYEDDEVTRVIQDAVDEAAYEKIRDWTVSDLREFLVDERTRSDDIAEIRPGLTSEMIAAAAKVMSNMDLIQASSKMQVTARCNNTVGTEGTLSFRLQPNDPTDDVESIRHSIREGLSYGVGDAVIGINPVEDNAERTKRLLDVTKEFIETWKIPTQNCVLSHLSTQLEAVENGARADLLFQSLAGTEAGNEGFGIDVELLDEAYEFGAERCTASGPNFMYFETGQGSELSSDAHAGVDQVTLEARCYGLAKRYDPFLVNTVVGFIGPEYLYDGTQVTRAGLEDVFMGKLTGVPMGIDACYTNHIQADQNDIENVAVLLTAAGSNYFITVPMGDDTMLNYQSNSYHDASALWDIFDMRPAPEFEAWLESVGIMEDGRLTASAGDPTVFLEP
ncbi:Ethanolamine ammonia-lyase heavy chain [Halopelagius inordinatus]|uniref:Putative ethanolamine ammonia-lyase large subunit n=1 Tax=Halopelagius inordinatus TaxID=553467 RepID=A0A1I2VFZ7_9EURY|nr:ethanolamine ammonia-lyase subunit EutB [Halopelagius inordinatus]SFG88003.1 Ethanolamine ammonia-lyase heavy chain [Halopelagius inordinatus]